MSWVPKTREVQQQRSMAIASATGTAKVPVGRQGVSAYRQSTCRPLLLLLSKQQSI